MPCKPNVPCRHPGCAALVPPGSRYCERHRPMHPEESRPAEARGYGPAWRRARKAYLLAHPVCEECKRAGKYVIATDVDHVVPHRGDMRLFWDEGNWQALCHSCHSKKTRRKDQHPVYTY